MSLQLINRLEVLDYLIQGKKTGSPTQLAIKLNISKRALYDFLNIMKELGTPIKYDKILGSYYYEEQGQFHIRFKKSKIISSQFTPLIINQITHRTVLNNQY